MAIAYLSEFPGMTQEHYDSFVAERYGGEPMPAVISHAAGPSDSGWWAFDVFESQEAADAVIPSATARLQEMGAGEPSVRTFEVHRVT